LSPVLIAIIKRVISEYSTVQYGTGYMNILVVDDELNIRKTLSVYLESRGHTALCVSNFSDARDESERQFFDLAIVDLRLGTESGLDLIPLLRAGAPQIKIIVITAFATVDTAVEAMKRGASDYIPKPFTPQQVDIVLQRIDAIRVMERRIEAMQSDIAAQQPKLSFSSGNAAMQKVFAVAGQVASSEAVVLITGPSGTGKTVLARAIHDWSLRREKPFGVISCPSLSGELLESELFGHVRGSFTGALRDNIGRIASCEGGTLFLDEIADLPQSVQPKLLRFIQEREYERLGDHLTRRADVRIIAATNADLSESVAKGIFREDLFYRLNVIQICIPPLCERPDDVESLANEMLVFFSAQNHKTLTGFSEEAISLLRGYTWPGNLRELRNAVERAVILCNDKTIGAEHLPEVINLHKLPVKIGDPVSLREIEEMHIRRVVASSKTLQEAADILGIDQATLWHKRKTYNL